MTANFPLALIATAIADSQIRYPNPDMIAKRVPIKSLKKSHFGGLVDYITDAKKAGTKAERLGQVSITNCQSDNVRWAIAEVHSTQAQNTRAKSDKTYHLIISFRDGENPSREQLREIEERICSGLGYGEHQRISAVHHDTDNIHIHVAINKIHPTRLTLHEPYYDHKLLGELCTKLEVELGLERDNHQPNRLGLGKAADMESAGGVESLVGWIRREYLPGIQAADNWEQLHGVLRDNGLEIRVRANGFVFVDREGTMAKASSVSRDLSKSKLEARLGPFEEAAERQAQRPARQYQPRPMPSRVDTAQLYAKYQAEQKAAQGLGAQVWREAKGKKGRLVEDAKRRGRLKRAAIKLMGGGRLSKKLLYALASRTLRDEINQINRQYQREIQARQRPRRAWADWLQDQARQGNQEALAALRAKRARAEFRSETLAGQTGKVVHPGVIPGASVETVTRKGTVIYRVGGASVRDDGKVLAIARGATQEGLAEALRLAMQRYGERIAVNGSEEFREQIAQAAVKAGLRVRFDDAALEKRRQELVAQGRPGHRPTHQSQGRGR